MAKLGTGLHHCSPLLRRWYASLFIIADQRLLRRIYSSCSITGHFSSRVRFTHLLILFLLTYRRLPEADAFLNGGTLLLIDSE